MEVVISGSYANNDQIMINKPFPFLKENAANDLALCPYDLDIGHLPLP